MLPIKYVFPTLALVVSLCGCVMIDEEPASDVETLSIAPPKPLPSPSPWPSPSPYPQHPTIPPFDPYRDPLPQCLACHPNGFPGPPRPYDPHWPNYPNKRGKKLPPGPDQGDPMCLACHTEDPAPPVQDAEGPSFDP
jgi:hypothetical protein